jgi:protoporphyrinogen oxidase
MELKEYKIYIVGAGVSGLVAAKVLEDKGFHPIILESSDTVGGRVKTDVKNGFQLDHGFQVLLTAYPTAQKYLDYSALDLQEFLPGAIIFNNKKYSTIGDPLREKSMLFPTLFSSVGSISDKLKILKLTKKLKRKSIDKIFSDKEYTTLKYLQDFGFTNKIIDTFFKPFFTGIFLETELQTSSRMFEFVYKMFGEGNAAIPKSGIGAIPKQLEENLSKTVIRFKTEVQSVKDGEILLENGEKLVPNYTIITSGANRLVSNLRNDILEWKSCQTLYFKTPNRIFKKRLIGLIPAENVLSNNIFFHTSLNSERKSEGELLSVTVVKDHSFSEEELVCKIQEELLEHCEIEKTEFIKRYTIPNALPNLTNLQNEIPPSETRLMTSVFLAGDVQLNGSLNAAMLSGELAAEGVFETITNFSF